MANNPSIYNLGNNTVYSSRSWEQEVLRAWGTAYREPDHRVYVMSNGRGFDSTDMNHTGIYSKTAGT